LMPDILNFIKSQYTIRLSKSQEQFSNIADNSTKWYFEG
jgi:hypothetical protein